MIEQPELQELYPLMADLERQYSLPVGILRGIAGAETGHIDKWSTRVRAASPAGAQGLMQFMPATAKRYGVDPHDPVSAIKGAAAYLADIRTTIGHNDPALLAAGYNAGENRTSLKQGNIPAIPETRAYARKVAAAVGPYPGDGGFQGPTATQLGQYGVTPYAQPAVPVRVGEFQPERQAPQGLLDLMKRPNPTGGLVGYANQQQGLPDLANRSKERMLAAAEGERNPAAPASVMGPAQPGGAMPEPPRMRPGQWQMPDYGGHAQAGLAGFAGPDSYVDVSRGGKAMSLEELMALVLRGRG